MNNENLNPEETAIEGILSIARTIPGAKIFPPYSKPDNTKIEIVGDETGEAPLFASGGNYWVNLARLVRYESEKAKLTNDYFEDFLKANPQYLKKEYQDQQ